MAARDEHVIEALNGIVAKHARWGFWKCHERLRLDGHQWNHKRTWRIYCAMRLNLPRRARKRLVRPPQPLNAPARPNEIWALDFMSDCLYQERRFRTLNILDEGVREALAIEYAAPLGNRATNSTRSKDQRGGKWQRSNGRMKSSGGRRSGAQHW
jgi:putative transposase